jgi:hypothetical protein
VTPEEQEAVRRALAATPPAGPMPPEVVARLEAMIADLAAERAAEAGHEGPGAARTDGRTAPVDELEERRRRRWPRVLVAAASVAVLGYGVGAVVQSSGPEAETASSDAAGGAAYEDGDAESGPGRSTDDGGAAAPQEAGPPGDREAPGLVARGPIVELRTATLRRDVVRHLELGRVAADAEVDKLAALDAKRYSRRDGTCLLPDLRAGDVASAARLDGRRATLVVHHGRGGTRVAEVYWCGDGRTLLAQTEVPARR